MAEYLESVYYQAPFPEVLIPVPLHPKRYRERGYNQAVEIARPICKRFALPMDGHTCRRIIRTNAQSKENAEERARNIAGAFSVSALPYQHVAVIDDVVTTGATVNELCYEIKKAGVERIDVWCLARTF